jgi:N-methylhydantoinase A
MPSGNGAGHDAVIGTRYVDFGDGERLCTAILAREALQPGFTVVGPAIVEEPSATTVVPPRQRLVVDHFGNLIVSPD